MKTLLAVVLSAVCFSALAVIDQPDVKAFYGTGYATNGWFSYEAKLHSDGDGVLLDDLKKFLLSPRYDAPIRKVALKVQSTKKEPTRHLRLWPLVKGVDVGTNAYDCAAREVGQENTYEFVSFDFASAESVDAVRLGLTGSGSSGNWRVAAIYVVYGEKTSDEDAFLKQFADELPPPSRFRVDDFSVSELHLAADTVEDAVGYQFDVARLDGVPLTEDVENFAQAPKESAPGWTLASDKASLTNYVGGTTPDTRSDDGIIALKIDKNGKSGDLVWVDVVTDEVVEPIREVSYIAKAGATNKSDRVIVYGRTSSLSDEWAVIGETNFLKTTSKKFVTNAVPESLGFKQVKFRFEAEYDSFTVCALDTLRVVYGGNEQRIPIPTPTTSETPCCDLTGLESGRYACKVRALGGSSYRDSSWVELPPIDLAWSTITMTAPEDVGMTASGGKLTVSWTRVAKADHYLVTIVSADDPSQVVAQDLKVTSSSVTVSVPSVGEYLATVTSVSPGGKSRATSGQTSGVVTLDELGTVKAEALDKRTIAATWKTIPLAESYQATLVRIGGMAETREFGWQADESGIALPEDWTCDREWDHTKWASGSAPYPRLDYTGCWVASGDCGRPITKVVCRFKCGSSSKATQDVSRFEVSVVGATGDWVCPVEPLEVSTKLDELTLTFPASRDVRKVRFAARSVSNKTAGDISLGKVAVTYGEETRDVIGSVAVAKGEVTFRDLDSSGRYQVVVTPQPSENSTSSSTTIDLATERFRETDAVSLKSLRGGLYEESFVSLTNVTADTESRKVLLDHWQFFKGSGATDKLLFTSGTSRTTGGVYAFVDDGDASLGTLATSTMGSSVGLAFRNDGEAPVAVLSLSFDTIQRSYKTNAATYILEWLVTDGAEGIGTEGDWQTVEIPKTAPIGSDHPGSGQHYRQSVTVTEGLPTAKIPVGGVLIFRWRHEKVPSGPMMAIDNVKVEFPETQKGFLMMVK